MGIRYLRTFYNERNPKSYLFIHAIMLFSLVIYSNEFTYLAYIRISDYMGRETNPWYIQLQSIILGFSKQTMYMLQFSAIVRVSEYILQAREVPDPEKNWHVEERNHQVSPCKQINNGHINFNNTNI